MNQPVASETGGAYHEVQWMRRVWWVMLLMAVLVLFTAYSFVRQILLSRPVGSNPGPNWVVWLTTLVVGVGFPIVFAVMRLIVEVHEDHVTIRYVPLLRRRIPLAEIVHCQARTYRPILDYGGWGIKGWSSGRIVYSISGNQGVELELRGGQRVMIGSKRADELATAIETALCSIR